MSERGGLVLDTAAGPVFVPASLADHVVQLGAVTSVPGLPPPAIGVAVADGRVATVISLRGPDASGPISGHRSLAIVCDVDGDLIAFVGGEVLAVGAFPGDGAGVTLGGAHVPDLDARGLYAELEGTLWATRALELARRRAMEGGGT